MAQIVINGKTYSDPAEMPPDVRAQYEQTMNMFADLNQNGIPDFLEGVLRINTDPSNPVSGMSPQVIGSSIYVVDGKVYQHANELPADARQKLEQAQQLWDADHDGVPDIFQGQGAGKIFTSQSMSILDTQNTPAPGPISTTQPVYNPVLAESKPSPAIVILAVGLAFVILVGLIILALLLTGSLGN